MTVIQQLDRIEAVTGALRRGVRSGWDLSDLPILDDIARDLDDLLDRIHDGRI